MICRTWGGEELPGSKPSAFGWKTVFPGIFMILGIPFMMVFRRLDGLHWWYHFRCVSSILNHRAREENLHRSGYSGPYQLVKPFNSGVMMKLTRRVIAEDTKHPIPPIITRKSNNEEVSKNRYYWTCIFVPGANLACRKAWECGHLSGVTMIHTGPWRLDMAAKMHPVQWWRGEPWIRNGIWHGFALARFIDEQHETWRGTYIKTVKYGEPNNNIRCCTS